MPVPAIAVFDIGKTNKKLFLFDESYRIIFEKSDHLRETVDEDGDPCEDVEALRTFILEGVKIILSSSDFAVRAINFSAYGASFVLVDERGATVGRLYNYLKPYPEDLKKKFYDTYGGEKLFSFQTASPVLGSLNSGMQLYRLKHQKPELFNGIRHALHLPQYLSFLITNQAFSEITSIGCHTNLWNFQTMDYHYWVKREGILEKLPPIAPSDMVVNPSLSDHVYAVGIGLHDSSSALIPYLVSFADPFVLISTGTWAISLNPFNATPLTKEELECDCLCYLQYMGKPVKASRLFLGHNHDEQVERIAAHFHQEKEKYFTMPFSVDILRKGDLWFDGRQADKKSLIADLKFATRDLSGFSSDSEAYHQLVYDLMVQQFVSTQLVLTKSEATQIFVDGGFGNNAVYMNMLAMFFPQMKVYASSIPQATAIGAALAIHTSWNAEVFPTDIIELKHYPPPASGN